MTNETLTFALPLGTILNGGAYPYRIEKVLGKGGFGITYLASTTIMTGNIPVKVNYTIKELFLQKRCKRTADGVTMQYGEDARADVELALQLFVNEAERLKRICQLNTHIVNVNEIFRTNGTAYYVMEYLEGGSVLDMLKQQGKLSEQQALGIIVPIAEAVSALHADQLLHMDIKPENIMMRNKGEEIDPVLIDFGISLHFGEDGQATVMSSTTGHSTGYAPMEQYNEVRTFAPRLDVYALGATLLHMLTGDMPVSAFEMSEEHIRQQLPAEISASVADAIVGAMRERSVDRTASVDDFIFQLTGVKPSPAHHAPVPLVKRTQNRLSQSETNIMSPASSAAPATVAKKRPVSLIIGAVVGLAIVGAVLFFVLGNKADKVEVKPQYTKHYSETLLQAAENNDKVAQYYLGIAYENGYGIETNPDEAFKWYEKSASQGFDSAQVNLGDCYIKGIGVSVDYEEAARWFEKAAAQENTIAMVNLGAYYFNKGDDVNVAKGMQWLEKASVKGDTIANSMLKKIHEEQR